MADKRGARGAFAVIEHSGAVSVKLGKFLKSTTAKGQLRDVRTLREYTTSNVRQTSSRGAVSSRETKTK